MSAYFSSSPISYQRGQSRHKGARDRDQSRGDVPTPQQRLTPQSLDAEQSTLGAMLMEADAISAARAWLVPDDFYRGLHRTICAKIYAMNAAGELVDLVTLSAAMTADNSLESCGGVEYLRALYEACPSSVNIDSYARVVLDMAQKRRLLTLSSELGDLTLDGSTAGEISLWLRNRLDEVGQREHGRNEIKEWSAAELLATEFPEPKTAVEGIIPVGLTIFAGAPKIGKSWLSYNLALAVASGGLALGKRRVERGTALYLSLEDTPRRLKDRLKVLLQGEHGTQAPPDGLRMMTDWPKLDEGGIEMLDAWLAAHPDCRIVVIDTLQKVRPRRSGDNMYDEDYEVFAALKRVADRHEVGIVAVMHTNKRDSADALQTISGSMGQAGAADAIILLSRPRKAKTGTLFITGRDVEEAELTLAWHPELGSYIEIDEEEAEREQMSDERQEITEILEQSNWPMTPRDIGEMLDKKPGATRKLLFSMKRDNQVKEVEGGKYTLPGWAKGAVLEGGKNKSGEAPAPPEPSWKGELVAELDINAASFSMFWTFWHGRYDSECGQIEVRTYLPQWRDGHWPG